jgi:hypothetical protein
MRAAAIIGCTVLAACTQSSDAARVWKAVPDHSGVFVDMASPVAISNFPYKSCEPGRMPTEPCSVPLDTKADVKVDGVMFNGIPYWCKNPDDKVELDVFRIVNGKDHTVPMAATKLVVCASSK